MNDAYEKIKANPRFHELTASRSKINGLLLGLAMTAYLGLLLTVALNPGVLKTPISADGVTTIAWPIGTAMVIFSWILTLVYVRVSNRQAETIKEILTEAGL
jgi:uncharacterized membrane protein (DUF485 family)